MEKSIRLLIVEDEFLPASLLARNLEQFFGYQICSLVATGEEAIVRAENERPDVVVMDIRLAGKLTGIEAAQVIHERWRTPILFVTGYSTSAVMNQCQALAPIAVLEKPVLPPEIHAAIQRHLEQAEAG